MDEKDTILDWEPLCDAAEYEIANMDDLDF